jgi:hypothetical protein
LESPITIIGIRTTDREEEHPAEDERSIDVTVQIEQKHILDVVSAILASGLPQSKGTPQAAVKAFHEVRTELVRKMGETERGGLPIYLLKRMP